MTNLVGPIPNTKGDVITTTNNGQGFNSILANIQDGNGNNSSILLSTQQIQFSGGFLAHRTPITVPIYHAIITDYLIAITVNAAQVTINLPTPTLQILGQIFIIKDEVGNADINNIIVQVSGGANIDNNPTVVIDSAYGSLQVYTNGIQYFRIF
jgi:hypothetical protein